MNWLRGTAFRAPWALLMGVLLSASAFAQVATAPGIKVGDGRLHPFLQVDGRYDSLVGYFNRRSGDILVPSGDLIVHARPGLRFELDNASTRIDFNGSGEYLWYAGIQSDGSRTLSRFQAKVGLDAKFNRDGAVEFQVGDNLTRSDRTQNPAAGIGLMSLYNTAYLAVPIHPGGRALEITPKAAWTVEFFEALLKGNVPGCRETDETCTPSLVGQMNYNNFNFGLGGKWKFLPKTAVVLDANFDWRTYFASTASSPGAMILRAQAGLAGLISSRISVTLMAGYGGDLQNNAIHTVIGTGDFTYTVNDSTRFSLGYVRNAMPVPALGVMIDDRGYLKGDLGLLGGRLTLTAQLTADYFTFMTTPRRNDFLLGGSVGPTVIITSWFDIGATYGLSFRTSSAAVSSVNFVRHEGILRLNLHY